MTCDVNDGVSLFAVLKTLAFAYLLNQRKNRIEQVLLCWKWLQGFRNTMWPAVVHFFPIFQVQRSLCCNLATKFCLHAAGGIYVTQTFTNSEGKIEISGSSANQSGGALLRSSSLFFPQQL